MKKIHSFILFVQFLLTCYSSKAQITGIKNIPSDFPTIQAAVAALNAQGVGNGGATILVPAGHLETFTAQVVLTFTTNSPSQANPLAIQKTGAGANPLITAFTPGVSTALDGIFILNGADYVTIDGIDLRENPANTTPTQMMEWGYALVKASTSNGCQNNTIKNCSVTLSNSNTGSNGIYIGNHLVSNLTGLTINSTTGASSNNRFYNNSIQNCYIGYSFNGYASPLPYDLYDQNNLIGVDGISTRRSQVTKFGGGALQANAIFATNQNGLKIHSTYINNTGAPNSTGAMYGILLTGGTNSNLDIYNDTITLALNSAIGSQLTGISCNMGGSGAGNSANIYNNIITNCTYPTNSTGTFRGIENTATSTNRSIYGNKITNNSIPGTGEFSAIYDFNNSANLVLSLKIYSNTITGNTKTGTSGNFFGINGSASATQYEVYSNLISNNNSATSSSPMYSYYNDQFCFNETVHSNTITNNISGSGEHISIYARAGSGPTNKSIYRNYIFSNSGNSASGSVGAISVDYGTICNIYTNNIYDIRNNTTSGISPAVFGINIGTNNNTQCTIHTNFISELKTPNASNPNAIYGLWLQGSPSSFIGVYFNNIYLDATSTGANFGSSALTCGNNPVSIDIRSNIAVNTSTPNGIGVTKALVRGNTSLTNYNILSGFNCLYAGSPGPSRLIYYDGSNSLQTMQSFKNLMNPRDQASFSELPPFNTTTSSPYDLHISNAFFTACEKGGTPVGLLTVDWDNHIRNANFPDCGADEFGGMFDDTASVNIQYPLLTNSPVAASKILTSWATITDPSNVNTTVGTKPRLYYKKSTEANTYAGNTAANNGWKYVEASNSSSPFSFNINYALLFTGGGVVAGDVIQYFVTAQDLDIPAHVGLNSGSFASQPLSVNLGAGQFPLGNNINQYNIVTNAYSGTINVGPTELVTSLTNPGGMFDLINQGVLNGNTTLNITGNLTSETGAIALNEWSENGAGNYTLTIQPSAAVTRTISGSCTTGPLVRFNGADRTNIDGRFNNSGTWLLFRNTGQHASVGYVNDAQDNTLQYSIIESGNQLITATGGGAVIIGTTTAMNGNDNMTINNCEIRERSDAAGNYPAWGINVSGSNNFETKYNNNITIKNNLIHDHFINGNATYGIIVSSGVSVCNISGNSLYQSNAKNQTTSGGSMTGIFISQPSPLSITGGFTVANNYIGGNTPNATGVMTLNVNPSIYQSFTGIFVYSGQILNWIEGNVIRGIDLTTNAPSVSLPVFSGINIGSGLYSVGTQTGNVIGAPTGTGSIKITINSGGSSSSFISGIYAPMMNGSFDIRNNTIGSILLNGSNTTGNVIPQWIQSEGTPAQSCNITNNLIGSLTTANSIINNLNAPTTAYGLRHQISTGAPITILSNTIQNITDNSNNAASQHYGIMLSGNVGNSGTMNVSNNLIKTISSNATPASFAFVNSGITCQGMAGMHTFDANTISGLSVINSGNGAGSAVGIQTQGGSFGGFMRRNYINNLSNAQTGVGASIIGIAINSGNTWEVNNNMISIINGANTNTIDIKGIFDQMPLSSNLRLDYNTVYIGGSSPTGSLNSYGFYRGGNSGITMRNNLFFNERAGSTASHVTVGNANNTNWNGALSDYNAFITRDTTRLAVWSGTVTNFNGWKSFSNGDVNSHKNITTSITAGPLFINAAAGDLHINTSVYPGGLGIPISVTNDIDNNGRSGTFPAVGADEIACPVPIIAVSQTNVACFGGNNGLAIATATGGLSHTYSWTPTSSTSTSITNLSSSTHTIKVTNHCALTGSLLVNITQPTSITPIGTWTDVPCYNTNSGTAAVIASGGTPGYTYSWSPSSSTSSVAANVGAGVQSYTVTDANGCNVTGTIGISQPTSSVAVSGSSTEVCENQTTGMLTATASGGTPGYTYSWTPNVSSFSVATNLGPGTYTLKVIDAAGCISLGANLVVQSISSPTVDATASESIICIIQNVTLTANASPGVSYNWSSGGTSSVEVVSLGVTTAYTVTVSYTNGCSYYDVVTVTVANCTDLNELSNDLEIQTYPNPSSGDLFVTYKGSNEGANVKVYNAIGQLILSQKIESINTKINLHNFANGLYIVKVLNAKGNVLQASKILKE